GGTAPCTGTQAELSRVCGPDQRPRTGRRARRQDRGPVDERRPHGADARRRDGRGAGNDSRHPDRSHLPRWHQAGDRARPHRLNATTASPVAPPIALRLALSPAASLLLARTAMKTKHLLTTLT